tara:strand:- start:72 stop:215 length:144 start_codon:yes stop_codon:yes gene_type:complete
MRINKETLEKKFMNVKFYFRAIENPLTFTPKLPFKVMAVILEKITFA